MDKLKKEIRDELSRTRLDKTRLYDLLLKIVDEVEDMNGNTSTGPRGEKGEKGEKGVCKCECVTKTETAKSTPKKTRSTKIDKET